jgi:hypothetical protein
MFPGLLAAVVLITDLQVDLDLRLTIAIHRLRWRYFNVARRRDLDIFDALAILAIRFALAFFLIVAVLFHLALDFAIAVPILFLELATIVLAAFAAFVFPVIGESAKWNS